ncbi:hypothetical protein [Devosia sp.]|uniref:hypothetical protein n=1 Tax=Devosia sp. TaxID=1871048 RepID=UPI0032654A77
MKPGLFVALLLMLSCPAMAFEPLDKFLPVLPANLNEAPVVFTYTAPHSLQMSETGKTALIGTTDQGLNAAFYDAATAKTATGIDFDLVYGVLTAGDPPQNVTVLLGEDRFAADAPTVLTAHGYTTSEIAGLPVLSVGEDYAPSSERVGDPLGSGVGKAVRLAIGDGFLLRVAATEGIAYVAAAMNTPDACVSCKFWKALLDALNTASGPTSSLDAATGFTPPAFFQPSDSGAAPSELPQYGLVILAATSTDTSSTAHVAVIFPSVSDARTGAKMISDRLLQQPLPANVQPSTPRIAITPGPGGNIAVISIDFPADGAQDGVDTYLNWLNQIYGRSFPPLALAN